ncbi:MAG: alpha/beta hydrolase [Arcanobacterium sp.]|nr:alpha/beta hydrolase [Arcanobacterium sp.]MDY5588385.1 alpha/beta hydrolase fold domain-containing protein [Arcanobacterium sp.]
MSERNLDGPRVLSSSSAKAAIEDLFAQTPAGPNSVVVREYWPLASGNRPLEIADVTSVVLWFHGGGLISGTARNNDGYCGRFAQRTRSAIISVEYRLAPDYPFPAALEDGVIALAYSRQIADEIGVPLLVSGASAGGGLAAAVVQCGTDCGISIDFQGLIYPMLNARTGIQKVPGRGDFIWTAQANQYGWASYLRSMEVVRGLKIVQYAVPSDRSDFSRLPPAWIGCGELDLFYGESKTYAQRLSSSGVAAHFESVPGMYHGADAIVAEAPQMVQFTNHFIEAMNCAVKAACN